MKEVKIIMTREVLKIMRKPQPSNFDMCCECWQCGEDAEKERIIKLLRDYGCLQAIKVIENIKNG